MQENLAFSSEEIKLECITLVILIYCFYLEVIISNNWKIANKQTSIK